MSTTTSPEYLDAIRLKRAGPLRLTAPAEPLLLPAPSLADALSGRLPRTCWPHMPAMLHVSLPQLPHIARLSLPHIPRVSLPHIPLPSIPSWWHRASKRAEVANPAHLPGAPSRSHRTEGSLCSSSP